MLIWCRKGEEGSTPLALEGEPFEPLFCEVEVEGRSS